jgi:hypothetical protein
MNTSINKFEQAALVLQTEADKANAYDPGRQLQL